MYVIPALNVNHALAHGLRYLNEHGTIEESRNGPVLVSPCPVMTMYAKSEERVLFNPLRDANPFFHFMEAMWMLAGRSDVAWPAYFNKRFLEYSDDGKSVNGAYGNRWRHYFGIDQIWRAVEMLKANPADRRVVIAMWDGINDLGSFSKDVPCNTHIYFRIREDHLDMTVCNRSNDIYWGAYGANAVHMSFLLEFMAAALGIGIGYYYQFSNNFHLYTSLPELNSTEAREVMASHCVINDHYNLANELTVAPMPIVNSDHRSWMSNLSAFLDEPLQATLFMDRFFKDTAVPMFAAWHERKSKAGDGMSHVARIEADDWRLACTQWIERRA